ncbi:MAG: glycosyltransferase, partial [Bacteroidales bacterium]|nr:glycosyltransferase [Bacteroidales bacterium]
MKVFFVIPTLDCGGAERVSCTLAKTLTGIDVKFINLGTDSGELKKWILPHFELESLNASRTISSYKLLKNKILEEKPDYIFTSHRHVAVLLSLIAIRTKTKLIVRIPTMVSNKLYSGLKIRLLDFLERLLLKKAYAVIAQTDEMKAEISKILKVPESKVITIINPVDKSQIDTSVKDGVSPFDTDKINFVAVGNISPAKAYDVLIKSFIKVKKQIPNANLYILGRTKGEYAEGIVSMAKGEDCIHFEGFKENPYNYINNCNAFVLS